MPDHGSNHSRQPKSPMLGTTGLPPALQRILQSELRKSLSVDALKTMLNGGIPGLASLANAKAVAEGRVLEQAITILAESNRQVDVLMQVRFPVLDAALDIVELNPEISYRASVSTSGQGRDAATPPIWSSSTVSLVALMSLTSNAA